MGFETIFWHFQIPKCIARRHGRVEPRPRPGRRGVPGLPPTTPPPAARDDGSTRARLLRRGRSLLAGGQLFTHSCLSRASTRASRGRILATMTRPRGAPTSVQDLGSPPRARARARSRARPSASRTSFDVDRPRGDAAKDARRRSPPHPPGRGAAMRRRRRQKESQIAFRRPPRRLDGSPRPQIVELGGDLISLLSPKCPRK